MLGYGFVMGMSLEELVEQNLSTSQEVFSIIFNGEKYWVKKARATKSSLTHKMYYFLLHLELIIPVEKKSPHQALQFEVLKIKKLKKLGIDTPQLILVKDDYFVMKNCGKNINSYIRKRDITKEKMYYYIDKALETLCKIHNAKEYHGGAQARNFTYLDGIVYAIDLEDSFDKSVDLSLLQYRDFLLFLLSLTKTRASFELDYNYIIDKYLLQTKNYAFKQKLQRMASKISLFIFLSELKWFNRFLGRDVKGFFQLFKILKGLDSE